MRVFGSWKQQPVQASLKRRILTHVIMLSNSHYRTEGKFGDSNPFVHDTVAATRKGRFIDL